MGIISMAQRFTRRVHSEGPGCIPGLFRARLQALLHRDETRREKRLRAAEEAAYQQWIRRHEQPDPTPFATDLKLSFLIPVYNTPPDLLEALAESLLGQTCPAWEACLYDGASPDARTGAALEKLAERDERFRVVRGNVNGGISGNTNLAFAMATGDVIALCDHDDLLAPDAVRCILEAAEAGADFIYTDEDKISADGTHFDEPHLKADFAPDSLRAGNYICHITAMTRRLAEEIAVDGALLRSAYDGSQDHDLALRATEKAGRIVHIPRILYHWRMLKGSFSHQKVEKCVLAACGAVRDQLRRLNIPAEVTMENLRVRIRYAVPETTVTAIVVGEGDTPPLPGEILRVADASELNRAAEAARGEYLLFLRAGMTLLEEDAKNPWVEELLMYAARPDVGCVGSAILDGGHVYQHAGYAVAGPDKVVSHHAGQWLFGRPYMITDRIVRNVTGVSSGLMLVRRELFLQLGGFGAYESDLRGADFGLRCLKAGLVNVYTPHARMVCRGTLPCLTGAAPAADLRIFREAWGEHPVERYYSPLFTRDGRMTVDMK